jgi:hypothetical protein
VDVQALSPQLREVLIPLQEAAGVLDALDDLSHALSAPSDVAAAASVLVAVRDVLVEMALEGVEDIDEELTEWLLARGAKSRVIGLFALRHARRGLTPDLREKAVKHGLGGGLALWLLADRLGRGIGLGHVDRPELEALMVQAEMVPLGALDAAHFWTDDD